VYALGAVQEYRVVCGYSDILGLPLTAVGAAACATGWSTGLRQLSRWRFEETTGYGTKKKRYTSGQVLNALSLDELAATQDEGLLQDVTGGSPFDDVLTATSRIVDAPWSPSVNVRHHWHVLSLLHQRILDASREVEPSDYAAVVEVRLGELQTMLSASSTVYDLLEEAGIMLGADSDGRHVSQWEEAIDVFKKDAGL
jgi:hypothetical protein